ncbi:MAG: U32 family peptidase [Bacilli bacterium]|jgi:putative protease|nr:U32 family peptidase [Bacilli bacterium]
MKKPELLAPAGDLEKLKIAILYGADAVYIGGKSFSLRSAAANFSREDIAQAIIFAHEHHAKVYVVVNIIFHNSDLVNLKEYLEYLALIKVDAIITADMYVIDVIKKEKIALEFHVSTQQSITNSYAIKFYEKIGASRVVLARETSYEQLKTLKENTNVELEYFIHGAMCVAFSGRCMLSNYYSMRDSNRGGCSQSCRWNYDLIDSSTKELISNEDCFFTMSSKDLSLARYLYLLIALGVDSFKIEGRMKSIYYLATIISSYRNIIDEYFENGIEEVRDFNLNNLSKAANRQVDIGFIDEYHFEQIQLYQNRDEHPTKEFIGLVLASDGNYLKIEQRNNFKVGDSVELFGPNHEYYQFEITNIFDENMNLIMVAPHPQQIVYLPFKEQVASYAMLRKVIS